ncbi:MAG: cell division protein FtsA [Candidatus Moraniibacteriota bacterium]
MAKRFLFSGIDIGSSAIRVVIAEVLPDETQLRILGAGMVPASGMRRGMVVDADEVIKVLNVAIEQAETMAGVPLEEATINVNGGDIFAQEAKGVIAIGKADGEVLEDDIDRVVRAAEQQAVVSPNRTVLHILPRSYRLDDQKNLRDPLGMHGVRLEADTLIIGTSNQHLKNLSRILEQSRIGISGFVADPIAVATAVLTSQQKELGVAVVNVGSAVTTLAVFEEGDILHIKVFPIGGAHITNDVAIGLRTTIEIAEQVKIHYGNARPELVDQREEIELSQFDSQEEDTVSTYHVAEIIEARLEEIFHFVAEELRVIGRSGLLPSGVILVGGGMKIPGTIELAKEVLALPVHRGYPQALGGILDQVDDPAFASVIGLLLQAEKESESGRSERGQMFGNVGKTGEIWKRFRQWMGRFLP